MFQDRQELAPTCKGQTIHQTDGSCDLRNRFLNLVSCAKRQQDKSAHDEDHNWEPFVENETTNKRVPKHRFPNLLATTDVLGHNLGPFFEKVPD